MVSQVMNEFRIADIVAALHGLFIVFLDRVFDTLFALTLRVSCVQSAFGNVSRAAEDAEFFKNDNFGTGLLSSDSGSQTGSAAADNNDVGLDFSRKSSVFFAVLHQLSHISLGNLGLLECFLNCALQCEGSNRCTGNIVYAERLAIDNLLGQFIQSDFADTDGFKVVRVFNFFNLVLADGYLDGEGSIMTVDFFSISSGCISDCIGCECNAGESDSHGKFGQKH